MISARVLRFLDRWVGTIVCASLSLVRALARLAKVENYAPPKRVIFVKLVEMGSTVLAAPAIAEGERMFGKENVFFLAFERNRPIVDVLPYFRPNNIIVIRDSSLMHFAIDLLRACWRVRRESIDAAIDLEGLTRSSAIICYLLGCRIRVGYYNFMAEGPFRGRLFTHELSYNFQHHIGEMFFALVRSTMVNPSTVPLLKEKISVENFSLPRFVPTESDVAAVNSMLQSRLDGFQPRHIVLLNPNCSDILPFRRWPDENYVKLAQALLERHPDIAVVVTGAPSEQDAADKIAALMGSSQRVFSVAGKTTLTQLLTLYHNASVLVSNDSGPCHFAALTPVHVVSLFGPETPFLYGSLSPRARCLTANLACSPCVNMLNHRATPCKDNVCMRSIAVEQVLEEVEKIIG